MNDPLYLPLPAGTTLQAGDEYSTPPSFDNWTQTKRVESLANLLCRYRRPIPEWAQPAWREMVEQLETKTSERDQHFKALQFNREVLSKTAEILGVQDPFLENFARHVASFVADRDRLRKALEEAPHAEGCYRNRQGGSCSCWKSEALNPNQTGGNE